MIDLYAVVCPMLCYDLFCCVCTLHVLIQTGKNKASASVCKHVFLMTTIRLCYISSVRLAGERSEDTHHERERPLP